MAIRGVVCKCRQRKHSEEITLHGFPGLPEGFSSAALEGRARNSLLLRSRAEKLQLISHRRGQDEFHGHSKQQPGLRSRSLMSETTRLLPMK